MAQSVFQVCYKDGETIVKSNMFSNQCDAYECAVQQVAKIYRRRNNQDPNINDIRYDVHRWARENLNLMFLIYGYSLDRGDTSFFSEMICQKLDPLNIK